MNSIIKRLWPWAAGALLVAALVMVGRAVMVARQAGSSPSQVRYATGTAETGDIEVSVTGSGTAAFADRRAVPAEVDGEVAAVAVTPGERVKAGQVLVELTSDTLIPAKDVIAGEAGRVGVLRVKAGDTVQQGAVLAEMVDEKSMEFSVQVTGPERELIHTGQAAAVMIDDFSGEVTGHILSVGDAQIPGATTVFYEVRIALDNKGLYQEGMQGQATIPVDGGSVVRRGTLRWGSRRMVTAPMAGRVESLDVVEGQTVSAGGRIARIVNTNWTPAQLQEKLVLRSPIDGVVVALNVRVGDKITAGAGNGSTSATGEPVAVAGTDFLITVGIDEMEVAQVRPGQEAEVSFPALGDRVVTGKVERVALEGSAQNGVTTYDVEIRLDQVEGVRAGMTATASIRVAGKEDALLVPAEAVTQTNQGPAVRVLQGGTPRSVPVEIGLSNDRVAEVLSGLRPGDTVVLAEFDPAAATNAGGQRGGFGGPGLGGMPGGGLTGRPRGSTGGGGRGQ